MSYMDKENWGPVTIPEESDDQWKTVNGQHVKLKKREIDRQVINVQDECKLEASALDGRTWKAQKAPEKDPEKERTSAPEGYPPLSQTSQYADPKNKKYPIDDADHVRAAISYFSQPANNQRYTPQERAFIWGRIKRAAGKFGIEISEPDKFSVKKEASMMDGRQWKAEEDIDPVSRTEHDNAEQVLKQSNPELFQDDSQAGVLKKHQKIIEKVHEMRKAK